MTGGFPTSGWAIIGVLLLTLGSVLTFAGKLISDLRSELKEQNNKILEKVMPVFEQNAVTSKAMIDASQKLADATQQMLQAMAIADARKDRGT